MEQLTILNQSTKGRLIEVAMVMRKVEIRLSIEQLASLARIMNSYLGNIRLTDDIDDKAIFYLLYQMYEAKVRKKILSLKQDAKLSLDMAQAWAMTAMLMEMDFAGWPYEHQVKQYIIGEINHQTV